MKISKRLLACLLSFLILFTALSPVVLAEEISENSDDANITCPTIYIHGFACGDIYTDIGTENETVVWPMQGDIIMQAVKTAIAPITNYLITHNWSAFEDALVEVVNLLFSGAWNNPDGTPKENSGIKWVYPEEITATSTISFNYDWRGDPLVIADELAAYIDYVLAESGCEKVAVECHSMGGIIFMSYAAKYGLDKIHGAIMDATAIYGASYMGELFANRFLLDGEAVYAYLLYAFSGMQGEMILNFLMDSLFASGAFDLLEAAGEELVDRSYDRVAKECLIPLFAYWPSIWAMIPDEDCKASEKYVFDTILADQPSADHTELRNKVLAYNNKVRANRDDILQELANTGRLMIIARYGYSMAPVSANWTSQSDGVIDTVFASYGATTAAYGTTLSDTYIAENAAKGHISPDCIIDASTCAFPENTWFIKDLQHSHDSNDLYMLKQAVLFGEKLVDVNTFEEYPQFLIRANGKIVPFENYKEPSLNPIYTFGKLMQTFRDSIKAWLKSVLEYLSEFFTATK